MVTSENTPTASKKVVATDQGAYLSATAGQKIQLNTAHLDLLKFSQDGNDLIVTSISDGQKIILGDFFSHAFSDRPPQLILSNGERVIIDDLIEMIDHFDAGQVIPAAGPTSDDGGGAGFPSYSDNGIGDGISTEDLLRPTLLKFSSFDLPEEIGLSADDISNDIIFNISADPYTIREEEEGTTTLTFTMSGGPLAAGNTATVTLNLGGDAFSNTDYSDFYEALAVVVYETDGVSLDGSTLTFTSDFEGPALVLEVQAIDDNEVEGTENISVTLSDATVEHGSAAISDTASSATVEITETDDAPEAVDDAYTVEGPNPTHAVFVMDTSGSMNHEELELMEAALKNLAKTLFTSDSNSIITLIDFDSEARPMGEGTFRTLDSVLDALDDLSEKSGGGTDYRAALDKVREVDFESGYNKSIYLLSDGDPDTYGQTHQETMQGIDNFNNWISEQAGEVDVHSVAIGDGVNGDYLRLFDTTEEDNTGNNRFLVVESAEDLDGSLTTNSSITGNVIEDDDFGDDLQANPPIQSISYNSMSYTLSDTVERELTLDTEFGQLVINFETGAFTYIATTSITENQVETIQYTIADGDGSTASANLVINIEAVTPPVATPDRVITNITDGDIEIPDAALLANDTDADGDTLTVFKVGNGKEGSVEHPDEVVFTPQSTIVEKTSTYDFRETEAGHSAQSFTFNPNNDANPFNDLTRTGEGSPDFGNKDELTSSELDKIASSNNSRYETEDPSRNNNSVFQADFRISDVVEDITQIKVSLEGNQQYDWWSTDDAHLAIWNWDKGQYQLLDKKGYDTDWNNDDTWSKSLSFEDGAGNYVGPDGTISIAFYNEENDDILRVDYVKVEVTTVSPVGNPKSFDYSVTDGNFESNDATVTIETVEGKFITGTNEDEIFLGSGTADFMYGNGGDDYLVGNAGEDQLYGGAGADVFAYQASTDGQDTIQDFDGTEDVIDLVGLFDALNVSDAASRAEKIQLDNTSVSGNTKLTVTGVSDFSITINGDLGSGKLSVAELTAQGINVGDES